MNNQDVRVLQKTSTKAINEQTLPQNCLSCHQGRELNQSQDQKNSSTFITVNASNNRKQAKDQSKEQKFYSIIYSGRMEFCVKDKAASQGNNMIIQHLVQRNKKDVFGSISGNRA